MWWIVLQGALGGVFGMLILLFISNNYDRWKLHRIGREMGRWRL